MNESALICKIQAELNRAMGNALRQTLVEQVAYYTDAMKDTQNGITE
jgi:hypothetical protein